MSKNQIDVFFFKEFLKENNLTTYENTPINNYRRLCSKLNYFMKHIPLSFTIKKKKFYEAVIVEFRILPHIEFIIRNAIHKLGSKWSYTIICGNLNYDLCKSISKNISENITVIKLNYDNMNQQEYSNFLMTKEFWNLIYGDKILIYQEDSLILKDNIQCFMNYDFIGAPFLKTSDDTPNCVGNGGLSLRTKAKMIEIINNYPVDRLEIGSSTKEYMKNHNLTTIPEDVYFSKNLQESSVGDVANWDTAFQFSSESVFNPDSFGCHKIWNCNDKWKNYISKKFNYSPYIPSSNVKYYLKFLKISELFDETKQKTNAFDIDLFFFCKLNNIEYINNSIALKHFNTIGLHGYIYHPKQINNFFPNVSFYNYLNNIYIYHNKSILPVQNFVNSYLYNASFDYFVDLSLDKRYDYLNNNYNLLILVYIGNIEKGFDLIHKLIQYKKIEKDINISFCFNINLKNHDRFANMKQTIKDHFDFYAIYFCKEYGTDIIPTVLMYYDIIKTHEFKHIIKLHTKSKESYEELTNYLLSCPLSELITKVNTKSHCIGNYYQHIVNDVFNKDLLSVNVSKINTDYFFVAGTIFYTTNVVFSKVLDFIKTNNYKAYLLNNLYENNSINKNYSPIHFLERLFGIIKL
jgi:hypothetical protein